MTPTQFPESTRSLGKPTSMTDAECQPLPIFDDGPRLISCWRMTWRERLSALLFGRVWCWVWTGSGTQPPICLEAKRTIFTRAVDGANDAGE